MGIKQLYDDYLRKLPNEYVDVSVMSDRATLHIYFSLAVSGSIGDIFEFTNLRSYSSKSEFFMFSSKINVRVLILKDFSFVYV